MYSESFVFVLILNVLITVVTPALTVKFPPAVENPGLVPLPPPDAAAKLASPLPSTVRTCPVVGVPPLSFRTTFIPGILNLVMFASPKVISLDTDSLLGAES